MSDSLLPAEGHSDKAATKQRHIPPQLSKAEQTRRRVEDEDEARRTGLKRSIWDSQEDHQDGTSRKNPSTDNKALKMMRAMGYTPGTALGVDRPRAGRSVSDEKLDAHKSLPGGLIEPLPLDLSRINPDTSVRRAGIGAAMPRFFRGLSPESSTALHQATETLTTHNEIDDFRSRASGRAANIQLQKDLRNAKETCRDLDVRWWASSHPDEASVTTDAYSPLWLQSHWFESKLDELDAEARRLVEEALSDVELEQSPPVSEALQPGSGTEVADDEHASKIDGDTSPVETGSTTQREEAKRFLSLPANSQLSLIVSHLRRRHFHCLWCGFSYTDEEDLSRNCPGRDEVDH